MIDQSRLFNYIITALLVFLSVVILSIYFGGEKPKLDTLDDFDSWRKRIDNRAYRMDKNIIGMKTKSRIVFDYTLIQSAKHEGLLFYSGRLRLTKKGYHLARMVKAFDMVNYNWNTISVALKDRLKESNHLYDIQVASLHFALGLDEALINDGKNIIKKVAYHNGVSYETMLVLIGLVIRDEYIKMNKLYPK